MASPSDEDDYWYSNDVKSFNFDEGENLLGVSLEQAENLKAGISNLGIFGDSYQSEDRQRNLKPLLSIISDESLAKILKADQLYQPLTEPLNEQQNDTLQSILFGLPYSLEKYKSLSSKTGLLDAAIKQGDGNAILGITLFIKKTLNKSLFQKLLIQRPEALYPYIHYLTKRMLSSEICDLLTMLGQTSDAALRCLDIILLTSEKPESSIDPLLSKIIKCYSMLFSNIRDIRESNFVQLYIKLLEWQKSCANKFAENLKYNCSALDCLRLSCKEFWGLSEHNQLSPVHLMINQEISLQQYQKIAIVTRASIHAWNDIDSLLHKKGWLGAKKLQTNLPIKDVIKVLQSYQAPSEVLEKFFNYVESSKRLELAKSLNCHRAVINILASQGDRQGLIKYKGTLRPQTEEYYHIEGVLCNTSIKWKN